MARKSRSRRTRRSRRSRRSRSRSRRSRRSRSRSRRGGVNTDDPKFLAKMNKVATQANRTWEKSNQANAAIIKAQQEQRKLVDASRRVPVKDICKNPFMKNNKRCKAKLAAAKAATGELSKQAGSVKAKDAALKKKIDKGGLAVPQAGGRRRRRRTKRRRKKRKSRRKRRKSRRTRRRRKSRRRRSKRRRR